MIILTWRRKSLPGPRAGDLEGSSLHSQRRVLLPGEEAFFYENGRGGKTGAAGSEKGKELIFHWRGGALNRETAAQMLKAFKEAGEKKGKYPRAAINWPQAVLLVEYLSELPAEELVTEEANEGEQQM